MTHIYSVTGMTCNGCKASVEKHLNALQNVISASVNLERQEVQLEMSKLISIKSFKTLLNYKAIQCFCLGKAPKSPMTKAVFIENTIMIIMAILLLFNTYL